MAKLNREENGRKPIFVGVGASAGGLDAFTQLLKELGNTADISNRTTLIFVQHLEPTGQGLLVELLRKVTEWDVVAIESSVEPVAGTVYVCLPKTRLEVTDGWLVPMALDEAETNANPIDDFLFSLADDQGEQSVGVILSGSGTDGTLGLKAISDAGGLTIAQDAESAKFNSMPRSAATTGVADHVLSPDAIALEITKYVLHITEHSDYRSSDQRQSQLEEAIPAIATILAASTSHNFQHYKSKTLTRRVARRMQVLKIGRIDQYIRHLEEHDEEIQSLFRDLLIGVTTFFRDPDAFEKLAEVVLPQLFRYRPNGESVRIWTAGCANGSEAYTLAILCREVIQKLGVELEVQIFATDIDQRALQIARMGNYPVGIEDHVSPDRLRRFFVKRNNRYQVTKEIREMVLFSEHNLISDPPFSRQDLIVCRNLLIYLGSHLQNKLIPLFHYALRPQGYLFLGPSENITAHGELFRPIDARFRITQRKGTALGSATTIGLRQSRRGTVAGNPPEPDQAIDLTDLRQRIVLDEFAPRSCIIDAHGKVLDASANLHKYLGVGEGEFQNDIIKMAARGLKTGLRAAIAEAKKIVRKVQHEGLSVRVGDKIQPVMVTVQPMPQVGDDDMLFMIVFHDVGLPLDRDDTESATNPSTPQVDKLIDQLETELETTRNDLERSIQDMEVTNEELKSSNEELLSMNEELQSANEELETSKEEIRAASDAIGRANADLENLLRSTRIATVFLDDDLSIRSFTPAITDIYELIATDIGRPLAMFVPKVAEMPALPNPSSFAFQAAAEGIEHTILAANGHHYMRRVLPYRSQTGQIDGIVITFTDITELQSSRMELEVSRRRLETIADAIPPMICFVDHERRYQFANAAYLQRWRKTADQIIGHSVAEVVDEYTLKQIDPHLTAALAGERQQYELRIVDPTNGRMGFQDVVYVPQCDPAGNVEGVHVVVIDVSDRKQRELEFEFRAEFVAELAPLLKPEQVMSVATERIATFFQANRCLLTEILDDFKVTRVFHEYKSESDRSILGDHQRLSFLTEEEARLNRLELPLCINNALDGTRTAEQEAAFRSVNVVADLESLYSGIADRIFAMTITKPKSHEWTESDKRFLNELAGVVFSRLERATAELELEESEQLVRSIAENSTEGLVMMDAGGYVIYHNRMLLEMTGYSEEEIRSKPLHDLIHHHYPDGRPYPSSECPIRRALPEDCSVRAHEDLFFRKDGSSFEALCAASPIFDDGQPVSTVLEVRDITEIKEAQRDLVATQSRLDMSMQISGIAPWTLDLKTNEMTGGEALNRLFGIDGANCTPLDTFLAFMHTDDRDRVTLAIQKSINDGTIYDEEYRIVLKTGDIRWVRAFGRLNYSDRGLPKNFAGIIYDVSDRKYRELDVIEREAHLRRVINNQLGLVGVIDSSGLLQEVDDRSLAIAKVQRVDVVGEHFADAPWWSYDPAVSQRIREAMNRAFAGEVVRYDVSLFAHGDEGVMIDFMIAPVKNMAGEVEFLIPSGVDIRERHAAEQAIRKSEQLIRESEAKFRVMADGLPSMIWVRDAEGRLLFINQAYRDYYQLSDNEILGEFWQDLFHPEDLQRYTAEFVRATQQHANFHAEARVRNVEGDWRWLESWGQPRFDNNGEFLGFVGNSVDVTDRKEGEARLEQALIELEVARKQTQTANASKSEFLANMSHEIRTPMTAILGYADLMRDRLNDKEVLGYLRTIRRNGAYLLDIINDILDLSKIEAGKFDLLSDVFDPTGLIEDVRSIMEVRAHEEGLTLEVEYVDPLPRKVESDPKRLKQILINLVGNAIKFTKYGKVAVHVRYSDGSLRIDVIDTGIGISEENQAKLFQPFQRGDTNVSRHFGGTGLGLAISHRLAELLGGDISVQSQLGKGSTFCATVRVGIIDFGSSNDRQRNRSTEAEEAHTESVRLNCSVLVVDDRRDIRFLSKTLLTKAGAEVDECDDGQMAVEYITDLLHPHTTGKRGSLPDLILLDMQMPNLDGYQTARALRELNYIGPIIALTADAMQGDMNECLAAGCNDYLSKPIDAQRLVRLVSQLTSKVPKS